MHPDIQRDVLQARGQQENEQSPIPPSTFMDTVREQARRTIAMHELMAYMAHRYVVAGASVPPQGIDFAQWQAHQASRGEMLAHLYALAQPQEANDG